MCNHLQEHVSLPVAHLILHRLSVCGIAMEKCIYTVICLSKRNLSFATAMLRALLWRNYIHGDMPLQKEIFLSPLPFLEELERFFRLRYWCEQLSFFERTSNVCNHKAFHFILCMPHQPPTISLDNPLKSGRKLFIPRKGRCYDAPG